MTNMDVDEKSPISPDDIDASIGPESAKRPELFRKVKSCEQQGKDNNEQKYMPPEELVHGTPWRPILLAIFLTAVGTVLLGLALLMLCGVVHDEGNSFWTVFFGGLITFTPGVYHVRLIYLAYHGTAGYSFDDIPSFD